MNKLKYEFFIGIDVSKHTLDYAILQGGTQIANGQIANTPKGLKKLSREFKKHGITSDNALIVCEQTGIYTMSLLDWGQTSKYGIWVENALAIKRSIGLIRGKSDKVDAYRIASYAFRFQDRCKLWQPPRKIIRQIKDLTRVRSNLIKMHKVGQTAAQEKACFLDKETKKLIVQHTRALLKSIAQQIKKVERTIAQLIAKDARLNRMVAVITSIHGIGIQTAVSCIVATNEFKKIRNARKLACYAGVAPFEHTSGTSIRGRTRVSHLACKPLKTLLHMAALAAIRTDQEMREYYDRKVAEGKSKMLVLNAIRNKLIMRICACIRDNRCYQQDYVRACA